MKKRYVHYGSMEDAPDEGLLAVYHASDVDAIHEQNTVVIRKQRERIEKLEKALNPRQWSREQSDAWHRAIPDVQAAFDALRSLMDSVTK
jgi:hypothetical protein